MNRTVIERCPKCGKKLKKRWNKYRCVNPACTRIFVEPEKVRK